MPTTDLQPEAATPVPTTVFSVPSPTPAASVYADISESQGKLIAAIAAASISFDGIAKDKQAAGNRFQYASLSTINRAIRGELSKAGVAIMQPLVNSPKQGEGWTRMLTILAGHGATVTFTYDCRLEDMAKGANVPTRAQAFGTAVTYMRRYLLCAVLNIEGEKDLDAIVDVGEIKPPKQAAPPLEQGQRRQTKPKAAKAKDKPPTNKPGIPAVTAPTVKAPTVKAPPTPTVAKPATEPPKLVGEPPPPPADNEPIDFPDEDAFNPPADVEPPKVIESMAVAPQPRVVLDVTTEQRAGLKALFSTAGLTKLPQINAFIDTHAPGKDAHTIDSSDADVVLGALRRRLAEEGKTA